MGEHCSLTASTEMQKEPNSQGRWRLVRGRERRIRNLRLVQPLREGKTSQGYKRPSLTNPNTKDKGAMMKKENWEIRCSTIFSYGRWLQWRLAELSS